MTGHEMSEGFESGTAKKQVIRHQNLEKKMVSINALF